MNNQEQKFYSRITGQEESEQEERGTLESNYIQCQHCGCEMNLIKWEARYGCLGQGIGIILIGIVGYYLLAIGAVSYLIVDNPIIFFICLGGILLALCTLNQKKKFRICPNCGYNYEMR